MNFIICTFDDDGKSNGYLDSRIMDVISRQITKILK